MKSKRIGERFYHSKYGEYQIIAYSNCEEVTIRFANTGYECTTSYYHIQNLEVRDRFFKGKYNTFVGVGETDRDAYKVWYNMIYRCQHCSGYDNVTVCDEWLGESGFINFYNWSMENGYTDELTIDRIDNTGNYEPSNCRWVDYKIQANNTSRNRMLTYNGKTQTMAEWSKELDISYDTLNSRINTSKMSLEDAFKQEKTTIETNLQNLQNLHEEKVRRIDTRLAEMREQWKKQDESIKIWQEGLKQYRDEVEIAHLIPEEYLYDEKLSQTTKSCQQVLLELRGILNEKAEKLKELKSKMKLKLS